MLAQIAKKSKYLLSKPSLPSHTHVQASNQRKTVAFTKQPFISRYLKRSYMCPTFSNNIDSSSDNIVITAAVAERIHQLRKEDGNKNLYLRIVVDSGGCNGYLAKFELDDKAFSKEDIVVKKDGADIVLDELSMGLMKGSVIDYVDEMSRSTFVIVENPNAGTSCGCNTSFSLKDTK